MDTLTWDGFWANVNNFSDMYAKPISVVIIIAVAI
ncbi:MAG: hypothetical protein JWQ43_2003, partial [Glaciihabitans sp.]|nr:hypothetical protein [Glaciihabitans sp.]